VQETYQDKTGTLMANSHPGSYSGQDAYNDMLVAGKSLKPPRKYIIRRLMPVECARLQGFPDRWGELAPFNPADSEFWESVRKTYAEITGKKYKPVKNLKKWYDKLHNDGAEYKMWGNGIALPCAEYVLRGIAERGARTLGSLFDGSGGFPLAGAINGIIPLWSSEVEPYPIAVTKSRFFYTEEQP
jgi:DNA (cytosine-5)-methyltransferase 1